MANYEELTDAKLQERFNIRLKIALRPWSVVHPESKDAMAKDRMLNWIVAIFHGEQEILTTYYCEGIGFCPSCPRHHLGYTMEVADAIKFETETGKNFRTRKAFFPKWADALCSILLSSDAIDYKSFEDWADDFGWDIDSIKVNETYRTCLELGLKMRNGLGDELFKTLRREFDGY